MNRQGHRLRNLMLLWPLLLAVFWGLGTAVLFGQSVPSNEPIVREVEFRWTGPETVSRQVIDANIQTVKGQQFSQIKVEQDVRNLMNTGYFLSVRVIRELVEEGVIVRFDLQGKSTIREVLVTGFKRFKEERLRQKIKTRAGDTLDERKLNEDAKSLTEYYEKAGFQDARVTPNISFDRDTGKSVVTYKIDEGEKVSIAAIRFTGTHAFSQGLLRKQMKTKKMHLFSWLSGSGRLKDEQFDEDLEKIRSYYHEHGYIDMDFFRNEQNNNLGYKLTRPARGKLAVTIDIFEGKQYKVGSVEIEGNRLFPTAAIFRVVKSRTNSLFTPEGLSKDVKAIQDYYGGKGYLDTAVRPIKSANPQTGRMDLRYQIKEGELGYIEKVVIRGNTKTRDKVIRRELAVAPGDIYNTVKVDRSRQRLENLGFFSRVTTMPEQTDIPNHYDLAVEVQEQSTGQLMFGAGLSSIDSLLGFVEVTQGNFDLFGWPSFVGGGEKLRLKTQMGTKRQDYTLNFTEPWFLNQRLSLGFDLYHTEAQYYSSKYSESRTGADLRLEKALGQWWRVGWKYGIEDVSLSVDASASAALLAERGNSTRSYMDASISRDTRNNVFLTTRGNRTDFSAEVVGGPLGGTIDIYKLQAGTSFYFPFFNEHVLLLQSNIGVVDFWDKGTRVPLSDRFFIGGASSIRGFRYRDVSPHDSQGEPIGGKTFWSSTVEYTFPIVEKIRGALFFDMGNVYSSAYSFDPTWERLPGVGAVNRKFLNAGAGFGFRLNLPIGPVRFDIGFPVISDDINDRGVQFHFNVGYQF